MIRKNVRLIAMALSCGIVTLPAGADGLSVSPTSISVSADVNMATVTVKADGKKRVLGQVRVVRWNRAGGNNDIAPTRNVVASPPSLNIAPNQEITVRIVRKAKSAVRSEDCYRILIDKLPEPGKSDSSVGFTIRQSIPLCFGLKN